MSSTDVLAQLWNVLNALVFPLLGLVFYMLRQQSEAQFNSVRDLLNEQEKQREKSHAELSSRVSHIERDFTDFKLNAAKTYLTADHIKNCTGELRDVQRKLETTLAQMNQLNLDWTREIHKCRESCQK
jgi:tetrahydromethanopterin S-methyltransferase subunit G